MLTMKYEPGRRFWPLLHLEVEIYVGPPRAGVVDVVGPLVVAMKLALAHLAHESCPSLVVQRVVRMLDEALEGHR